MSRRVAVVEEFDDETELPLPSHPLPNTAHGPLLQEIGDSDEDSESSPEAGPASSPPPHSRHSTRTPDSHREPIPNTVTSLEPYKTWTCIYPIYIDAKRRYGTGERQIAREKSVWWPLSKDIADATNRLGLGTLHEVNKCHPRDWENPGRVRVQWKKDGKYMRPSIRSKKQLLETVARQIQNLKADNIPKPPYVLSSPKSAAAIPPAKSKGKQASNKTTPSTNNRSSGRRLPIPPEPHPPLATRVSPYSPALASGVFIETVKAGMNAPDNASGAGAGPGPGASGQKGKRRVVRVRA